MKSFRKAIGLASLSFFICSCSAPHYKDVSYAYGTSFEYHLFEGRQKDIDSLINLASSSSYACDKEAKSNKNGIAAINENGKAVVEDWLLDELKLGVELCEATNGYFSLFCGGLTDLWLSNLNDKTMPTEAEIAAEVALISQTSLQFNGNEVIKTGDAKLDLGGLGKGYCLERIKASLKQKNLSKYWVSAGGSSIIFGENPNGKEGKTRVELEDLPEKNLYLKNTSISTSSCAKQLYEVGGTRYSHIVNPFTGSAKVEIDSVIAIGENAAILDALTTAVYLEGTSNIKTYETTYSVSFIVTSENKITYATSGIELVG